MRKRSRLAILGTLLVAGILTWFTSSSGRHAMAADSATLDGLLAPARIVTDINSIPHIYAANDHDAMMLLGYVHARDRFFQMDLLRRQASGMAAELLGKPALASDIQLRTFGLRRAAEASLTAYSDQTRALLEAYAKGVNTWLHDKSTVLPPEYNGLELTMASVPDWTPVDTLTIGKAIAFQLSFTDEDMSLTVALAAFQKAGQAAGFDGAALFNQDVMPSAPFNPATTIRPVSGFPTSTFSSRPLMPQARAETLPVEAPAATPEPSPESVALAKTYLDSVRNAHLFAGTLEGGEPAASNWVLIGGRLTESGHAMLASDPHLSLGTPPVWYEAQLVVDNDPQRGPMNAAGVTFAGIPGVILGCNRRICWGATVNAMDVVDVYQERIGISQTTFGPGTLFDGQVEPLIPIPQTYRVNQVGNGKLDDLAPAAVSPLQGGLTLVVPRRNNGPIVSIDSSDPMNITALSMQYTGWGATRELQTFLDFDRAGTVQDFQSALQFYTFGSQNFGYADVDGNIAHFTSGALPLREDLQTMGRPDGMPPYLIRDGTHHAKNEWLAAPGQALPFQVLPATEMPQVVNPPAGYIVSANNDPAGTNIGNNPLGAVRGRGGVFYLGRGFDRGYRAGQLVGLIQELDRACGKIAYSALPGIQASNQMLDAQVFVPYIAAAFANAGADGAAPPLAAYTSDATVADAVRRLAHWNYSTPTGLREGYDPGDDPANMSEPSPQEVDNSVAATIYSTWRSEVLKATIDATLARYGLGAYLPDGQTAMVSLRNLLDNFSRTNGVGTSGVNFFQVDGVADPAAARDVVILRSLRGALNLLASDAFAPAFAGSTNLSDYRWGKLHRIVFQHVMGAPFSIPPAAGFAHLAPGLPGVARAGGWSVPDASNHNIRVKSPADFMFSSGPSRRFIGDLSANGINASQIIPGGQSGVLGKPAYANMLKRWLTNGYHPLLIEQSDVDANTAREERFNP